MNKSEQQIDDAKKHGIKQLITMEHCWASFMGRRVFSVCKTALKRPMQLLSIFEKAGKDAEEREQFLEWKVPITKFPVVQYYVEGTPKKVWVQYGGPKGPRLKTGYFENTLQLTICIQELLRPSPGKQSSGAAPNAIHSLDAAHLMMISCRAPFNVTTIHDSFGCLLGDMPELFVIVREQFVKLYEDNPLYPLMNHIGGNVEGLEMGDLDIESVIDSEYAFV